MPELYVVADDGADYGVEAPLDSVEVRVVETDPGEVVIYFDSADDESNMGGWPTNDTDDTDKECGIYAYTRRVSLVAR